MSRMAFSQYALSFTGSELTSCVNSAQCCTVSSFLLSDSVFSLSASLKCHVSCFSEKEEEREGGREGGGQHN